MSRTDWMLAFAIAGPTALFLLAIFGMALFG
jgi:hypothetical protein